MTHIEIRNAVVGKAAEVEISVLLLGAITCADYEFAERKALPPIDKRLVADALRVVERRRSASPIGFKLIHIGTGLHLPRAG